jgi:hypothetical protein
MSAGSTMATLQVSEADWQATVIETAQRFDWLVAHFRPARTAAGGWRTAVAGDGEGYPDLTLTRRGRLILAELKGPTGRLREAQRGWIFALEEVAALSAGNVEVHVWRPSDWDAVLAVLR